MYTAVKKEIKSTPKPKLVFAHPEEDGSGSVLQVEMHPATLERQGSLMVEFVEQTDDGYCDADGYHHGGFDWAGSLKFRLGLTRVGKLLRVLNGSVSEINPSTNQPEQIRRRDDSVFLWCDREMDNADGDDSPVILLTAIADNKREWTFKIYPEEILVLRHAIEGAMSLLAWGDRKPEEEYAN